VTTTPAAAQAHPAYLDLDAPLEIARWRPLVQWLLAIPQLIIAAVLGYVAEVVLIICFFAVLFTRRIPDGLFNFQVMTQRYSWRAASYAMFMRESYPPFDFTTADIDPGGDPAVVGVAHPGQVNRWLPLVKWLLAIPHYIVLAVLGIVAIVVLIVAWFAVIITGRYPEGIRDYLVGVGRWSWRVWAYVLLLRDEYPPFSLKP
jgi:hypothetical protein